MSNISKVEKEKAKLIQEKCQLILGQMLRDEDNKFCVDCDAKGPRWASWNLGIFLCIRCAGIHRNLGVHISRVKSVNLDSWTPEQVVTLQQMGNSRARAVYEANLPDNFRRPQTDSTMESFIRAKYEQKKYIAREWVQPPPVKVSWDAEIEFELKQKKEAKRKMVGNSGSPGVSLPAPTATAKPATASASVLEPVSSSQPLDTTTKAAVTSANISTSSSSHDLLGLDVSVPSSGNDDLFGGLLSGPQPAPMNGSVPVTTGFSSAAIANYKSTEEESFFNQKVTSTEKKPLDKNSILALYNQSSNTQVSAAPVYATQAGLYSNSQMVFNQQALAAPGMLPNQGSQGTLFQNQVYASNGVFGMQTPAQLPQQLANLSLGGPVPSYARPVGNPMAPNMVPVPGMMFSKPTVGSGNMSVSQLNSSLNGQSMPPNFWQ